MLVMLTTKQRDVFYQTLKRSLSKAIFLKNVRLNVSNAALRTVDFKGGLDKFLKSAKNRIYLKEFRS